MLLGVIHTTMKWGLLAKKQHFSSAAGTVSRDTAGPDAVF
jgi:hypothetical protein